MSRKRNLRRIRREGLKKDRTWNTEHEDQSGEENQRFCHMDRTSDKDREAKDLSCSFLMLLLERNVGCSIIPSSG